MSKLEGLEAAREIVEEYRSETTREYKAASVAERERIGETLGSQTDIVGSIDSAIAAERQRGEGREDVAFKDTCMVAGCFADEFSDRFDLNDIAIFGRLLTTAHKSIAALRARPSGTFAEGVETSAVKAEENKLYWAAKVDPLNFSDASNAGWRAKSAACFQVEMDIRVLSPSPSPSVPAPARVGSEGAFIAADFLETLDILRNSTDAQIRATLSNRFNIILAALNIAASTLSEVRS